MKWQDTIASKCRYGDIAGRIFKNAEIIYEFIIGETACQGQGSANVFASMPNGTFVHYEWDYGSCSGCDDWMARKLSDDQIEAEMRKSMAVLKDADQATAYLKGYLNSGVAEYLEAMSEAFVKWSRENPKRGWRGRRRRKEKTT